MFGSRWRLFASFGFGSLTGGTLVFSITDVRPDRTTGFKSKLAQIFGKNVEAASPELSSPSQSIAMFGEPSSEKIRHFKDYVLCYDNRHRSAAWVFEHLTPEKVSSNINREDRECYYDLAIDPSFQAHNSDYINSGYDKGHLAAAGNRGDEESLKETFILSNIAPQVGQGFNRGAWNQLEESVRRMAKMYQNVYVFTGPLFLPQKYMGQKNGRSYVTYEVIGQNNVSVPTHFFKIVLIDCDNGNFELLSYVMPNAPLPEPENKKIDKFLESIDVIERATGLKFCSDLPTDKIVSVNNKSRDTTSSVP